MSTSETDAIPVDGRTRKTAFFELNDEQIAEIETLAEVRTFEDGEVLFAQGERGFSFFVVKSGVMEILSTGAKGECPIAEHGERQFSGDVDLLTGRPSPVTGKAKGTCVCWEVTPCKMRRLLSELPSLSEQLLEAFQLRRKLLEEKGYAGISVIGSGDSKETLRIREFLYKNQVPHSWVDAKSEQGRQSLSNLNAEDQPLPILTCYATGATAARPELSKVAECIGIRSPLDETTVYDLTIIGSGPAGLAAAVYGASEGLKTLVLDRMGPGGQAGTSSKIENYMGFPSGLSGADLANRAYLQALKFGATFSAPEDVQSLSCDRDEHQIQLGEDRLVRSRAVLIASGASYRRLPMEGCERFEGAGVYYSATSVEANLCRDGKAVVIGGGNSAGQAAMYLSENAADVKIMIRGDDLGKSMSRYLCERIEAASNIEVLCHTELSRAHGNGHLEAATIVNNQSDKRTDIDCTAIFGFIGARPHTEWVPDQIAMDSKGFIITGASAGRHELWPLEREACAVETTCPGVFAAGDVRSESTKRVAFAVGDGALAVTCAHKFLSGLL